MKISRRSFVTASAAAVGAGLGIPAVVAEASQSPASEARVARAAQSANGVTILYDAFGESRALTKDWGFSALLEYGGKRVLFDTGDDADVFARNLKALNVDVESLDFAVVSHRHGDHTSGLNYLLSVNPHIKIYTPKEAFGVFGASLPGTFYRRDETLPARMRYYDGQPPNTMTFGTPWRDTNFAWLDTVTEVVPGIHLIPTVSQVTGSLELRELSMALKTSKGLVLIVGCSHPGIEKIVEASVSVDPHVHMIVGGLHLVTTQDDEIARVATALQNRWKVDRMAPAHCSGEPAFATFQRTFGDRYLYAGLGTTVELPQPQ